MKFRNRILSVVFFAVTSTVASASTVYFGNVPEDVRSQERIDEGVAVSADVTIAGELYTFSGMRRPAGFENSDSIYDMKIQKKTDANDEGYFFINMSNHPVLKAKVFKQFCNLFSTQGTSVTGGGADPISAASEGYIITAESSSGVEGVKKMQAGSLPYFNMNHGAVRTSEVFCGH
jgi:hypothetical protein